VGLELTLYMLPNLWGSMCERDHDCCLHVSADVGICMCVHSIQKFIKSCIFTHNSHAQNTHSHNAHARACTHPHNVQACACTFTQCACVRATHSMRKRAHAHTHPICMRVYTHTHVYACACSHAQYTRSHSVHARACTHPNKGRVPRTNPNSIWRLRTLPQLRCLESKYRDVDVNVWIWIILLQCMNSSIHLFIFE
jgi:hypothetical protein